MTDYNYKKGDRVKVVKYGGLYAPDEGNTGTVVSTINDYPKIKFDNQEVLIEDLNGLCTVDPLVLELIK